MTVVKVLELVGESKNSWQEAATNAVTEAARTVDHITGVEVVNWTAGVDNGQIRAYKANIKVAFVVDGDRQSGKTSGGLSPGKR
ncbi:MAG: dodecin family protein [Bacillota bacterium]